jgi:REP element-mobilizing transposase RayT
MRGKSLTCREPVNFPQVSDLILLKYTTSIDYPCLFITAVAKDRLPVFRAQAIKEVTCAAIDEARTSCGFLLFAYVLMPDHIHLLTDSPRKPSVVLQYIKGIIGRRAIDYLKEKKYASSLSKLQHVDWKRNHRYSLWQHDSEVFSVTSEATFMQKVNYIHLNPVRAGLAEHANDYRWSSSRYWSGCPLEAEPLTVDMDKIVWRRPATGRRPVKGRWR